MQQADTNRKPPAKVSANSLRSSLSVDGASGAAIEIAHALRPKRREVAGEGFVDPHGKYLT